MADKRTITALTHRKREVHDLPWNSYSVVRSLSVATIVVLKSQLIVDHLTYATKRKHICLIISTLSGIASLRNLRKRIFRCMRLSVSSYFGIRYHSILEMLCERTFFTTENDTNIYFIYYNEVVNDIG